MSTKLMFFFAFNLIHDEEIHFVLYVLQMVKMMVTVVFVYTLCWLPFNIFWVSIIFVSIYKLLYITTFHLKIVKNYIT